MSVKSVITMNIHHSISLPDLVNSRRLKTCSRSLSTGAPAQPEVDPDVKIHVDTSTKI